MAKDPALLFYTSDFMLGTAFFTMEERGQYISLLCYQHQLGHLSETDILTVTTTLNPKIMAKFKQDADGKYYNERLEDEQVRRKSFTESRMNNLKKHKASHMAPHMGSHMETETATETITDNTAKKVDGVKGKKEPKAKKVVTFVRDNPPSLEDVTPYCLENGIDPHDFHNKGTSTGWVDKHKVPYRDWKAVVRMWKSYRKATGPIVTAAAPITKRPIALVVLELIALKRNDHEIMQELAGKYTEHAIIEACGHARGNPK